LASILKINNPTSKNPRILLAPLDWGLGHATRCIPIIKELLILKFEIWVAATGDQKALLKAEFPSLSFVELPGYGIKYDKNRALTYLRLLASVPKILIRIKEENRWLRQFVVREGLDAVISDNRYGLWHRDIFSVLITHQLSIQSSLGAWVDRWVQGWHYRLIGRFHECWVPDMPEGMGLAGKLSHPGKMPAVPTRYIGILSRMEGGQGIEERGSENGGSMEDGEAIDLMVLLSGPEPQRTILEKVLWTQLGFFQGRAVFVRGIPRGGSPLEGASKEAGGRAAEGISVYDHLPGKELNELLLRAKLVVARSGYSTVMDLVRLKKRAILIPTPGQTEQEYLGKYLTDRRVALSVRQAGFSLTEAIRQAEQFPYVTVEEKGNLLRDVITQSFSPIDLG
jgi:hypothetical protein